MRLTDSNCKECGIEIDAKVCNLCDDCVKKLQERDAEQNYLMDSADDDEFLGKDPDLKRVNDELEKKDS